ncbi:MAG: MBL fold metallo-hydrolase [Oscillospiraceae bacterium]|jgi:phosphoribosyl 1,2-cyclic phosphodiesterase|nr:MBL fold metallo-hydrolase [Oscillospiraceae bacterium]
MGTDITLRVFGSRGSTPVHGSDFTRYGGATSCIAVNIGGESVILDAGSGLTGAAKWVPKSGEFSILISHPHIDHIIGLTSFAPLHNPDNSVRIFAAEHGGLGAQEQVERLMSAPLWPLGTEVFSDSTQFCDIDSDGTFQIGAVRVDTIEGNHPGGCTVYKLTHGEHSIVYCTDFEHDKHHSERLASFAADCELLIYDAQFSDAEYETKQGWGHSTREEAVRLARRCGVRKLLLFHHSPSRTDDALDAAEALTRLDFPDSSFAKREEVVLL